MPARFTTGWGSGRGADVGFAAAAVLLAAVIIPGGASTRVQAARPLQPLAPAQHTITGDEAVAELKRLGRYDSLQQAMTAARYKVRRVDSPAPSGSASIYRAGN